MQSLAEQFEKESDVLLDKVCKALLKYTNKKTFNIVASDYSFTVIDPDSDSVAEVESVTDGVICLDSGTKVSISHHQDVNILIGIFSIICKIKPTKIN